MEKYQITLTFQEPILGTAPKDPEVYATFIASRAALNDDELAEELATVEETEERGWTGFRKAADGTPVLMDYMIKGFFKDVCGMLRRVFIFKSSKIKAYKKIIDGLIFVEPRYIPISCNGGEMSVLERPLRASTAQGERVTLARSDTCPAGSSITFTVIVLGEVSEELLREWLDYGHYRGLGQWRNAGWGKFEYEMEKTWPV